ncbi:MAG: LacI family DNA-binding transcriptional regulator [bacterium]|nr:LacI family DNA-binding transcriptional regulator [bacterium]
MNSEKQRNAVQIRIELLRRNIKLVDIARIAGVSVSAVSRVISGKLISRRIMSIIDDLLDREAS